MRCEKKPRHRSHTGGSKYCDGCLDTITCLGKKELRELKASCIEPSDYTGEDIPHRRSFIP
jgi:hypothetical protein